MKVMKSFRPPDRVFFLARKGFCFIPYLKDLLTADLNAAMAGLGLVLRKLLSQNLQLLHQVSLVLGNRQALCLFW